jgi:GDP-L-fucose synthase
MNINNSTCLISGGSGMIGRALVDKLVAKGCIVTTVSLDETGPTDYHIKADLRHLSTCIDLCSGYDYIFHLAGVKGSPKLTATRPADFFVNTILFNTNMLEAIRLAKPKWALYTSSVGVYAPTEVFQEDSVWSTLPSPYDRFAGWAKRMGELQVEAYSIQYTMNNISILRPSNVFGPYDNFDLDTCMVVPATIRKVLEATDEITMWGDGAPIRDFVYSKQVADQMIFMVEKEVTQPLNAGSGNVLSIKDMVNTVVELTGKKLQVNWDTTKPSGDKYRTMDMTKALSHGFKPTYTFREAAKETISWYLANKNQKRYDPFKEIR